MVIEPTTVRQQLRQWQASDRADFARMNADPEVRKYFPSILSVDESNALAMRIESLIAERGWGLWAVEEKASGFRGRGYAVEAAQGVLDCAFEQLALQISLHSFLCLTADRRA